MKKNDDEKLEIVLEMKDKLGDLVKEMCGPQVPDNVQLPSAEDFLTCSRLL